MAFTSNHIYASIEIAMRTFCLAKNDVEELGVFSDSLFIKIGNKYCKVNIPDLLFIQSDGKFLHLNCLEDKKYTIRSGMETLLDVLKNNSFLRVHRSFAINGKHLEIINGEYVIIQGNQIPIGPSYRQKILASLRTLT